MLTTVVTQGTGTGAGVTGWQIYGKTGTTDIDDNSYFVGGSPYAVIGVWTGYQNPSRLRNTNASKSVFQSLMGAYLNTKQLKQFTTDSSGGPMVRPDCTGQRVRCGDLLKSSREQRSSSCNAFRLY